MVLLVAEAEHQRSGVVRMDVDGIHDDGTPFTCVAVVPNDPRIKLGVMAFGPRTPPYPEVVQAVHARLDYLRAH